MTSLHNLSTPEVNRSNSENLRASSQNFTERPMKLKMPSREKLKLPQSNSLQTSQPLVFPSPSTPCSIFSFDTPISPGLTWERPRFERTVSAFANSSAAEAERADTPSRLRIEDREARLSARERGRDAECGGRSKRMAASPGLSAPSSPRSIFSFDIFDLNSLRPAALSHSPSIAPTHVPSTPTSRSRPRTPLLLPRQQDEREEPALPPPQRSLPAIEEIRSSFSFPPPKLLGDASIEEGGSQGQFGTDQEPFFQRTHWPSIYFLALILFLTRIQFTVYLGSLWPFLQQLDRNVTATNFAVVNAAYSIGLATSAPLFGIWSNYAGCIRIPSLASLALMIAANVAMLFVHNAVGHEVRAVLVSRLLSGIAAGGNALLPSYWTYAAAPKDRSTAAALFDSLFCLGICLGPGSQLIFSWLMPAYPGLSLFGGLLNINAYTMSALFATALAIIALVLTVFLFNEVPMHPKEGKRTKKDKEKDSNKEFMDEDEETAADLIEESLDEKSTSAPPGYYLPPPSLLAIALCLFARFVQMFIYANMETIGSMYTQHMFGLSRPETSNYNSLLCAASGVLGFLFLLAYILTRCGRRIDNRCGVMAAICVCVSFLLVTYPYPLYEQVPENEDCQEMWCGMTRRVPQPLYTGAYVLVFGIGFAAMNVHLGPLYSSVLGPRRQGTMVGINTLFAGLSRVLGPLLVTVMFSRFGPASIWLLQIGVWAVLLTTFILFYHRLSPLTYLLLSNANNSQDRKENIDNEDSSILTATHDVDTNTDTNLSDSAVANSDASVTQRSDRARLIL